MAVGKPGAGKSTFLRTLAGMDSSCHFIDTDRFADLLAPQIENLFPGKDIVNLALNDERRLAEAIGPAWIELLKTALRRIPKNSYAFLEIPYGLMAEKRMYRFIGGRIIYFGCSNDKINLERNLARDTPQYIPFIDRIPGKTETENIARENRFELICVDTSGALAETKQRATDLLDRIRRRDDG